MSHPKSNRTTFRKGRQKTGGRRRGQPNKTTRVLQEALLIATEEVGNQKNGRGLVGYLKWAAVEHAASVLQLLGRLMPQQLETKQTSHTEIVYRSAAEIRQELIRRGVPLETIATEVHAHVRPEFPRSCIPGHVLLVPAKLAGGSVVRHYQYQHRIVARAATHHAAWLPHTVVVISQAAAAASVSIAERLHDHIINAQASCRCLAMMPIAVTC